MATCKDCVHVDVYEDITRHKLSPSRAKKYCLSCASTEKRVSCSKTAPDLWSCLITNILRKNDFRELFKNLLILRKLLKLLVLDFFFFNLYSPQYDIIIPSKEYIRYE